MSIVIDTPDGIAFFALLQVRYGLSIQAATGLRHSRGSLLKLAQRRYGVRSRTCAGAVEELDILIERAIQSRGGADRPGKSDEARTDVSFSARGDRLDAAPRSTSDVDDPDAPGPASVE